MSFTIEQATRESIKLLVAFFGKSGGGKTLSALFLARGLSGPSGRIVLIDSESKRGSLFVDLIPNRYRVINIDPPFSPMRYEEAFISAEADADVVVIDSLSHEHNGEGGVLDMQEAELDRMAGDDWKKREACKMAAWIKPKFAHKKFIQRILRSKVPLICCLRGEEKTHMVKGPDGKQKVVTDEFSTPLFDPRFLFELLLCFEVVRHEGKGGFVIPRKVTHPDIEPLLPKETEQIGIQHGQALAAWCAAPTSKSPAKQPATQPNGVLDVKALKRKLWKLTEELHQGDTRKLNQFLWDQAIISDTESVETLTPDRLAKSVDDTEKHLLEVVP